MPGAHVLFAGRRVLVREEENFGDRTCMSLHTINSQFAGERGNHPLGCIVAKLIQTVPKWVLACVA